MRASCTGDGDGGQDDITDRNADGTKAYCTHTGKAAGTCDRENRGGGGGGRGYAAGRGDFSVLLLRRRRRRTDVDRRWRRLATTASHTRTRATHGHSHTHTRARKRTRALAHAQRRDAAFERARVLRREGVGDGTVKYARTLAGARVSTELMTSKHEPQKKRKKNTKTNGDSAAAHASTLPPTPAAAADGRSTGDTPVYARSRSRVYYIYSSHCIT